MRKNMTTSRALSASLLLATAMVLASACSSETKNVYLGREGPLPTFTSPDAGDAGAFSPPDTLTAYCPSNRCPAGHTTCPSSQYLCDVDLRTDLDNCGECGNRCPGGGLDSYTCVEGRCVLICDTTGSLDCDGLPDNGCEANVLSNDNCGYCGNQCPADKPCIDRGQANFGCGCEPGEVNCGGPAPCIDPTQDDANCGACGNACPPQGDGTQVAPPNTYFGCFDSQCGTLKCNMFTGDCDGLAANGCEASTASDDHCGACGNKCPDGMQCRLGAMMIPQCMCAAGQTLCGGACFGDLCIGTCWDLASSKENCGACGNACALNVPNANEACVYGKCEWSCNAGWGDCNGNRDDGCETNISSDPKNCGGCGITCDGIAGQACVDGQCMVEPCDVFEDAGGTTR